MKAANENATVSQERHFLIGRHKDGTPTQWHGPHVLHWVRPPRSLVSFLVAVRPEKS